MKIRLILIFAVIVMCSFTKKHRTHINGRKAVVIEHCYKYHTKTTVTQLRPTKGNSYLYDINEVKICDSATYDTIYKN